MSEVIPIERALPHRVSEVICVKCGKRWICARPAETLLAWIQCGGCDQQGYVIETGEVFKPQE